MNKTSSAVGICLEEREITGPFVMLMTPRDPSEAPGGKEGKGGKGESEGRKERYWRDVSTQTFIY